MRLVRVAVNGEQLLYQPPGGIGRYTAKLVTLLPRVFPDDQVTVFTARHSASQVANAWRAAGMGDGGEAVRLPLPRAALYEGWNTLGWPRLDRLAPVLGHVDVVHAPSVAVPPRSRAPLVVTVHDVASALFPETFPWHGRWFHARGLAAAARRATLVITVSRSAAAEIQAHSTIAADRLRIVPNGVDHIEASAEEIVATRARHGLDGAPYILWVGTLEPRKDVGTLVRAFADLVDSGQAAGHRLALAGPAGWLSSELVPAPLIERLGGAIRLLGTVGEGDLRALYAGATLFALPSRHEGFGLPVLEAMAQRTPVVCSDIPALREVSGAAAAEGGDGGPARAGAAGGGGPDKSAARAGACGPAGGATGAARLVAAGDVEAWAEALAGLMGDDAARRRLGQAGWAWASNFSWERTVRETRAVYVEALGGGG